MYCWFIHMELVDNSTTTHTWTHISVRHVTAFSHSGVWVAWGAILNSDITKKKHRNSGKKSDTKCCWDGHVCTVQEPRRGRVSSYLASAGNVHIGPKVGTQVHYHSAHTSGGLQEHLGYSFSTAKFSEEADLQIEDVEVMRIDGVVASWWRFRMMVEKSFPLFAYSLIRVSEDS